MAVDCDCGVRAVGRCTFCARAFCASHRGDEPDQCRICLTKIYEEIERIEGPERARREAEAARQASQVARVTEGLLAIPDPYERLIVSIRSLSTVKERGSNSLRQGTPQCHEDPIYKGIFSTLFPHFPNVPKASRAAYMAIGSEQPNWDSAAVAEWFASRARQISVPTDGLHQFPRLDRRGKVKHEKPQPVWVFKRGAHPGAWDAYIARSGAICPVVEYDSRTAMGASPIRPTALRPTVLHRMADLLGLTPVT